MLNKFAMVLLLVATGFFAGCSTMPPSKPNNICDIFDDKPSWYKDAHKAQKNWGSSIPVMMSIMYQESMFRHNARPARTKILWIFPGPRPSNAFGYAQAKNDVWNEYQKNSGNVWSRRDSFADAIDFVGWYNKQSQKRSKIRLDDAYNLYLAYHDGHGGFNRGTYRKKNWLMNTAQKVDNRASDYTQQLARCESRFKNSWWPF